MREMLKAELKSRWARVVHRRHWLLRDCIVLAVFGAICVPRAMKFIPQLLGAPNWDVLCVVTLAVGYFVTMAYVEHLRIWAVLATWFICMCYLVVTLDVFMYYRGPVVVLFLLGAGAAAYVISELAIPWLWERFRQKHLIDSSGK